MLFRSKYLIDTGKADTGPAIKISNSIFAKTFAATLKDGVWTSGSKGIRGNVPTVSNSYMTADGIFGSNSFKGCNSYAGTSDDLFTNPSKGDFSIKDNRFETGVGAVIE